MTATLAIVTGPHSNGFACSMPGVQFASGEYRDRWEFIEAIEQLLRNGLKWRVYAPEDECRTLGVLEYLCFRAGADLYPVEVPTRPSAAGLRAQDKWRQGMPRANAAARLLTQALGTAA